MKKFLCLLLTLALLLCGCDMFSTDFLDDLRLPGSSFEKMEYIRPDMAAHDKALEEACKLALESSDLDAVLNGIYAYYDAYDLVNAAGTLSYIHYCQNPNDLYWSAEYEYCAGVVAQTDAGLEELYCALAKSPIRDQLEGEDYFGADYFDAYEDGGTWDDQLLAYMEREAQLQEEYYSLSATAEEAYETEAYYEDYALPLTELLIELVKLRREMAEYMGYGSVAEMTYEWYHYRDYSPEQVDSYLESIAEHMVPLYRRVMTGNYWDPVLADCTMEQTYAYTNSAAMAMGGNILTAFKYMTENGLYDITYSETKASLSFETYILYYNAPYVFTAPYGMAQDKLTFAHEFGHFVNDYLCAPSYAGTDVAEIHSQGMEYLSLFYALGGQELEQAKLADCLETYVVQAGYAAFEQELYRLQEQELNAENVMALFEKVGNRFGFDSWDFKSWEFTLTPHFYTSPMYVISYVVSNDVAFQVYQLEKAESGAGLKVYNQLLTSQEAYLLSFVETYKLESPFAPGRVQEVSKLLEEVLQPK